MNPEDLKQLEALGSKQPDTIPAPPSLPVIAVTRSQHEALALREEFAERKAIKSREAEVRARATVVINALAVLAALIIEIIRALKK